MITTHQFVGLRQWGINPPDTAPCQHDGCGMPKNQHIRTCTSTVIIKGEAYPCDMIAPHGGWPHSNKMAEAVWGEGKKGS